MATERQIAANRRNAQSSTGPSTEGGKRRSRRNALRHGLTAESVITVLEDEAAYRKFEAIILRDHGPETAVERALVVRLASLLWRLRRAVAIETGLFAIQAQILRDRRHRADHDDPSDPLKVFYDLLRQPRRNPYPTEQIGSDQEAGQPTDQQQAAPVRPPAIDPLEMAVCFLRLENFNPARLDLIGRYETRLWKQLAQTVLILRSARRTSPISYRNRREVSSMGARDFSGLHHRF
jgi:hypothetical protein